MDFFDISSTLFLDRDETVQVVSQVQPIKPGDSQNSSFRTKYPSLYGPLVSILPRVDVFRIPFIFDLTFLFKFRKFLKRNVAVSQQTLCSKRIAKIGRMVDRNASNTCRVRLTGVPEDGFEV